MDLRKLKKECKKAVEVLVRDHGYNRDDFTLADGSEALYAPVDLETRFVRHGFIEPGVLKGTLVRWYRCSYEYDEWDCELPSETLREIEFWSKITPEEVAAMHQPATETIATT